MTISRLILAATALCLAAAPVRAETAGSITVDHPWARAAVQGGTGGAFATIRNTGAQPDRLTTVSSPVAGMTELHESSMEGGVMRMRPVNGLDIPAGGTVQLHPGGLHLMLMHLKQPLRQGSTTPLTLHFEHAGDITVQATVEAAGAGGHMAH